MPKNLHQTQRVRAFLNSVKDTMMIITLPVMLFGSIWLLSLFDYNLPVVNAVEKYHRWKK
ncbi:hypothetical protein Dpoa2040_001390 [Dickeya sp. CFBP 2040]|uniref:hypothetical protein n=1 Tax=Dickeya sp. CFBP 2040 TaxID=2718531 RepID=UPI001445D0C2|nr:hypothetical protein [Dickeya sp. CFBP 2040]NKI74155.1 hypothetical protein [Dickeya sp. CFBP 2040]